MHCSKLGRVLLLAVLASCCNLHTAAHEHDSLACSHHHPDVVAQNALLLAHRLALIEALEGPAASAHAAQAAGLPFRAQAASPNERDSGGGRDASAAAAQEEGLDQLVARAKAARLAQLLHQGSQRGGAPAAQAGAASRRLAASPAAAAAPIRIRPVFQLDGVPPKPAARITNEIIPTAIAAVRKFVRVKAKGAAPQEAPRPFDGRQSCLASIPGAAPDPAKEGYDLLLYVTGDSSRCFPGMIAMSAACEIDPVTGRPTLGSLNICAEAVLSTSTGQVVDTVVHEMVHVLGFSPTHYPDWRGPDGKRYDQTVVRVGPKKAPFLATPRVLEEARRQFNCSIAPGGPLETEGMGMSSSAHWEYRNTQHELMTAARPLDRQRAVMSRLTLAALEDSGWYQPDYSQAADLEWGAGAGCTFLLGSCQQFAAENPRQDLFCPQGSANTVRCSAGARLWGVCRASSFTDGCLIVGRDAPKDSGPGGAASDFSGNFDCLPPYALDAATKALLPRIGASGMARDDRCFDLVAPPQAAKGAKTLCVAGGGGGAAQCASERALCFRAACDAKGALSVVIQGAGGAPATKLACPTGTTLNLAAKATGRFSSGALRCPDNARTCRGLACGACDPAGGFCSLQSGRCNCWVERTGPSCGVAVAAAKQSAG